MNLSRHSRVVAALIPALLVSAALVAQTSKRKPLVVDLRWLQTEDLPAPAVVVPPRPITLRPLSDGRGGDPQLIGQNLEKQPMIADVRARGSVLDFVNKTLKERLSGLGMRLEENAEMVLSGELVRLFVTETNMYDAEVTIRFRLENRDGSVRWESTVAGSNRRWGRSLKAENYNERISDALMMSYIALINDQGFRLAWSEEKTAPAAATSSMTVADLKSKILAMQKQDVAEDLIVTWVSQQRVSEPIRAEVLLDWKASGIPDSVIKAALSASRADH
jgi:hypothetical protein